MTNREMIIKQLQDVSDKEFFFALSKMLCPSCFGCAPSIRRKCEEECQFCHYGNGGVDWVSQEYDEKDGILLRNRLDINDIDFDLYREDL